MLEIWHHVKYRPFLPIHPCESIVLGLWTILEVFGSFRNLQHVTTECLKNYVVRVSPICRFVWTIPSGESFNKDDESSLTSAQITVSPTFK